MTDHTPTVQIEDPPLDLDDVQQREPYVPAVRTVIEGPVRVQNLPNRTGNVTADTYNATDAQRILYADPKRAVATLVGAVAWFYCSSKSGVRAPIPANQPIVVTHADEVWCLTQTGTGVVTAIIETFAD